MKLVARLRSFARALMRRSRMEREMDDEMQFHLEARAADLMTRGLTRGDAERRAREEFGDAIRWKEEGREARGLRPGDDLRADLRYAIRMLRRRPVSSVSAMGTLAIGIGLNAAVFSIVDWVLLRPLPFPAPGELVRVHSSASGEPAASTDLTSSEVAALSAAPAFQSSGTFSLATRVVRGPGFEPAHVVVARVAGELFGTLGARLDAGRGFTPGERASGAAVVVSHAFWQSQLSADPDVIGRPITIDRTAYAVVGVVAPGQGYPRDADLWRPVTAAEREDDDRENVMIARLQPGISAERASVELATLSSQAPGGRTMWAEDLQRGHTRDIGAGLRALWASSALVLLLACANVAALIGARASGRVMEISVRSALGATRSRLVRQLLTESLLLAAFGGVAGLLLGRWALDLLVAIAPHDLPRVNEIALDGRVVILGACATIAVGFAVGIAPALAATRREWRASLIAGGSRSWVGHTAGRRALVASQMAIAVVLTIGAGLLGRSLQHLLTIDHGFAADRLVAIDVYLRDGLVDDPRPLFRRLVDAATAVPGVRAAAVALRLPTETAGFRVAVSAGGGEQRESVTLRPVTPGYFDTVGIPIVDGRGFTTRDRSGAPPVAVVNAAFANRVAGNRRVVGLRLTAERAERELTIVGVVADVTPAGEPDHPAMYVAADQIPVAGGFLLVRSAGDPRSVVPAVTARIRSVAPGLPLDRIQNLDDALEAGRAVTRFNTQVASAFAMLSMLLAAIGVYGLTAAEVSARWRELAVRLALGAGRHQAFWTVIRPGAGALTVGIAAGVAAALGVGTWMATLLHGVGPGDRSVLLAVPAVLAAVGLLAATLASARVLRVDPAATLRHE